MPSDPSLVSCSGVGGRCLLAEDGVMTVTPGVPLVVGCSGVVADGRCLLAGGGVGTTEVVGCSPTEEMYLHTCSHIDTCTHI